MDLTHNPHPNTDIRVGYVLFIIIIINKKSFCNYRIGRCGVTS